MKKKLEIEYHLSIENSPKDVDFNTGKRYKHENKDHYSEWALAVVLARYNIGDTITIEEFNKQILKAKIQQFTDVQCEKGYVQAVWNEKLNDVGYIITKKGAEALINENI